MPRARHLLSAKALHALWLDAPARHAAGDPEKQCTLFEVGCGAPDAFLTAHIPGAGYIDTQTLETLPFWNALEDAALLARFAALGIDCNGTVILYSRNLLAAARVAHLLLYAGVQDVRLLDGGWDAWCAEGLPVDMGQPAPALPQPDFGLQSPAKPHFKINLAQAKALQAGLLQAHATGVTAATALVSIRTWEEHSGQTSGYSYIDAKGDIPGALWGHAGKSGDVNDMSDFHHPDGTMRSAADITALWARCGIHSDMEIAFYCGTGWRASLAFFYAWLMGWEHISVFDGGWMEWSASDAVQGSASCAKMTP